MTRPFALALCWLLPALLATAAEGVDLYLFWSQHCPHCLETRPQVQEIAARHPWIRLHDIEISGSPENLERYAAMARAHGEAARYVPALFYCGRMEVGLDDAGALLERLSRCHETGIAAPDDVRPSRLRLPLLGEIDAAALSLPLLTVLLAGMDAFNPCAFFVLLFLLSLLTHQRGRGRMLAIGLTFVAISGLMYFAFMAAWLGLFVVVGGRPWVTAAAGMVALAIGAVNIKDYAAFRRGPSLSIPDAGRADIFRRSRAVLGAGSLPAMLGATAVLAVAANSYELLCTAGFPMAFTRLLTLREPGAAQHYAYLALYNAIYVLPLLAIVVAFVRTMGARRMSERQGRLLKLLSGLMMAGLGALLLLAPGHLDDPAIALALPAAAGALTWLAARLTRP